MEEKSRSELPLVAILAAVQFSHIMDFVIMMPLGPALMRVFDITPRQFGFLVSSYTISAAIFGLLLALVIDRFDRRTALLYLYAGFAVSTMFCALAPNYTLLLLSRIVAGACGGLLSAMTFSIVGDLIPDHRRGAAMGTIMSSFAMASIAGVPFGLFLAARLDWHAPFILLAVLSLSVWVAASKILPSIRGHLDHSSKGVHSPGVQELVQVITHPNHMRAFALMVAMMMGSFSVIPYLSPYMVSNTGVSEGDLAYVYLVGGLFTFFSSRYVGKLVDRVGKQRVFRVAAAFSILPIFLITILPPLPLVLIITCSTLFMILLNARMVPATAIFASCVEPKHRGAFMSVNSSVQQAGSGFASFVAGLILTKGADGRLEYFWVVGALACIFTLLAIPLAEKVRKVD